MAEQKITASLDVLKLAPQYFDEAKYKIELAKKSIENFNIEFNRSNFKNRSSAYNQTATYLSSDLLSLSGTSTQISENIAGAITYIETMENGNTFDGVTTISSETVNALMTSTAGTQAAAASIATGATVGQATNENTFWDKVADFFIGIGKVIGRVCATIVDMCASLLIGLVSLADSIIDAAIMLGSVVGIPIYALGSLLTGNEINMGAYMDGTMSLIKAIDFSGGIKDWYYNTTFAKDWSFLGDGARDFFVNVGEVVGVVGITLATAGIGTGAAAGGGAATLGEATVTIFGKELAVNGLIGAGIYAANGLGTGAEIAAENNLGYGGAWAIGAPLAILNSIMGYGIGKATGTYVTKGITKTVLGKELTIKPGSIFETVAMGPGHLVETGIVKSALWGAAVLGPKALFTGAIETIAEKALGGGVATLSSNTGDVPPATSTPVDSNDPGIVDDTGNDDSGYIDSGYPSGGGGGNYVESGDPIVGGGDPEYSDPSPTNPTEDPENPTEDPEDPSEDPEDPTEDPEDPTEDPEDPTEDPEDPTEDPEDPTEDPEDPEDPTEDPENPTEDPEDPTEDPEDPTEDPEDKDPNITFVNVGPEEITVPDSAFADASAVNNGTANGGGVITEAPVSGGDGSVGGTVGYDEPITTAPGESAEPVYTFESAEGTVSNPALENGELLDFEPVQDNLVNNSTSFDTIDTLESTGTTQTANANNGGISLSGGDQVTGINMDTMVGMGGIAAGTTLTGVYASSSKKDKEAESRISLASNDLELKNNVKKLDDDDDNNRI